VADPTATSLQDGRVTGYMSSVEMEEADDRAALLAQAFAELAGALADGYDVAELLDRLLRHCVDLLAVDAAGLVLADASDALQVMAATTGPARFLEVLQLHAESGPCLECYHTGRPVQVDDLRADGDRWPALARNARDGGYRAVHAVPLKFQQQTLGAMNLFNIEPGCLGATDQKIAGALAEVATVAILGQRSIRRSGEVAEQLQTALDSRVIIEQAKGMLAQQGGLPMPTAFAVLRQHARRNNQRVTDAARAVVDARLTLDAMSGPGGTRAVG
jgi:transcriptional regulator with GAF, ATPase, and Fis domain